MSFQSPPTKVRGGILLLLALILVSVSGCRSDRVSVNKNDANSPQYEYRLDEFALLQMIADDIQELERKKQYGKIYDDYTTTEFRQGISRRRFMIMSNCVETYLGGLEEFNPHDLGFRREKLKSKSGNAILDVLNRKVQRAQGAIEEQMVFMPIGLNFKLNGLYWIAKDKQFLQCIAQSPDIESATQPKGEETEEQTAQTEPEQTEATESDEQQTTASEETSAQDDSKPASADGNPPVPAPVQEMKPAEIKKAPLEARPAGAGAVIDQRPVPKKVKKTPESGEAQPEEPSPSSPHGSGKQTDSVPAEPEGTGGPPTPPSAENSD